MNYDVLNDAVNKYYSWKGEKGFSSIFPSSTVLNNLSFYKYCSMKDDFALENIKKEQFYLNCVDSFNDIFDCLPTFNFKQVDLCFSKLYKIPLAKTPKDIQTIKKHFLSTIAKIKKEFFCSCFTSDPLNILMWAHYANNFEGICIEYDLSKALEEYDTMIFPVVYSTTRPKLPTYVFMHQNQSLNDKTSAKREKEIAQKVLLTKSSCWSYEKEYRVFVDKKYTNNFCIENAKIKAVYLGIRINEINKKEILNLAKNMKFKVYETNVDDDKFQINCKEIF